MKKLIIAAILLVSITGFAQNKSNDSKRAAKANMEKLTPEERTEKKMEKMTKDLSLDAKQQEKMRELFKEENATREKQRAENKKNHDQAKEKMEEQRNKMNAKTKAILTPEQFAKWERNKSEMKDKMTKRRGHKKDGATMNK